jgi:hypothetical protein
VAEHQRGDLAIERLGNVVDLDVQGHAVVGGDGAGGAAQRAERLVGVRVVLAQRPAHGVALRGEPDGGARGGHADPGADHAGRAPGGDQAAHSSPPT